MTVKIDVVGLKKARKFLSMSKTQIKIGITRGISKATLFVQGEVKSSIAGRRAEPTSVDTGRFLNSVDFQTSKDNGVVFSKLPYAKFLEFGTGKFRGRRHFNNSKDRSKKKIRDLIDGAIK